MKTDFLCCGAVLFTLLALSCPWQAAAEASGHKKKLLLPTQAIDTGCEAFLKRNKIEDVHDCDVSETGTFGSVDGQTYDYALYMLDKSMHRGLSIFTHEAAGKQAKMLLERCDPIIGMYIYLPPAIITNSFGTLMHVYIEVDGSGHYNESEYYLWKKKPKGWMLLNSTDWIDELVKRISPKFILHKGIWPDLKTMTVSAGLRCKDYRNCSFPGVPGGGGAYDAIATGKIAVKHGKVVVESVEIEPYEQ